MKVRALLQYVVTQEDGSEKEVPLPDNCPDSIEMEVDSMKDVVIVVPVAVDSHFKALGVERPANRMKGSGTFIPPTLNRAPFRAVFFLVENLNSTRRGWNWVELDKLKSGSAFRTALVSNNN